MIVHLFNNTNHKFSEPYFDFIERRFSNDSHLFIILGDYSIYEFKKRHNLVIISYKRPLLYIHKVRQFFDKADKIILHQLFISSTLMVYLIINRRYLNKIYWMIWGGDLYDYKKAISIGNLKNVIKSKIKHLFVKEIKHIIAVVYEDYLYAVREYGVVADYFYAFYSFPCLQSIHEDAIDKYADKENKIRILVGNSGSESNNHLEILRVLHKFKDENIEILCPLSYGGTHEYIDNVCNEGDSLFAEKFIAVNKFLLFPKYVSMLKTVDIAIFNNDRQQALGNIIMLLYLGKKIFIRSDITTWKYLCRLGLYVEDIYKLNKLAFDEFITINNDNYRINRDIVKSHFSEDNCAKLWAKVFNSSD